MPEFPPTLVTVCAGLWMLAVMWHVGTLLLASVQPLRRRHAMARRDGEPALTTAVSVLVPVSSPAPALAACAASLADLVHSRLEVILCCAQDDGPAIAAIREQVRRHPSLQLRVVAPADLGNPKSALLQAALPLASHDLLLLSDDNVVSSRRRVDEHLALHEAGFGLVSACALGTAAESFWGEVDAAFMNGHFARLQCAGDALGLSFSTGKSMMVSRRALLAGGGFANAGDTMCEDAVVQRQLAAAGHRAVLAPTPVYQPIGRRAFDEVWHRHLRWATCRRRFAPALFALEMLTSTPVAMLAGAVVAAKLPLGLPGVDGWVGAAATAVLLLGVERIFLGWAGWPVGRKFAFAWIVRELLAPALWLAALLPRRAIVWRRRSLALRR